MAACASCGSTILFGGFEDGGVRTCSEKCRAAGALHAAAARIPEEVAQAQARALQRGPCPACGRRDGPVDLHVSYRVYSLVFMTSWQSRPFIACRPCANRRRLGDSLFSLMLGWWGIPWGLLATPVQIGRNVVGLLRAPAPGGQPSAALVQAARLELAARAPPAMAPARAAAGPFSRD